MSENKEYLENKWREQREIERIIKSTLVITNKESISIASEKLFTYFSDKIIEAFIEGDRSARDQIGSIRNMLNNN